MMTVTVDAELCLGSQQCARSVPTVFSFDDDGVVQLVGAEPSGPVTIASVEQESVRRASFSCPAAAIYVEDRP